MTDATPALERSREDRRAGGHHSLRTTWPIRRRQALELCAGYLVVVGVWIALGMLLTGPLAAGPITGLDQRVAEWMVQQRTGTWDTLSLWGSGLAETWVKALVTATIAVVMVAFWHRWIEALTVAVALVVEASAFLAITLVVGRPRPAVDQLDESPIGSSFPSGHVAAAVAYAAIAVVVFWHTRNRAGRAVAVAVCTLVPLAVGLARMYRGMHFLSDVVAGAALGGACVALTVWTLRRTPEGADAALGRSEHA